MAATKSSSRSSSHSKPYVSINTLASITAILAILIHYIPDGGIPSITGDAAKTKPYRTWNDFYGHYQMEHTDRVCRQLHVIGTIITSTILVSDPRIILCGVFAGSVGVFLCGMLRGLSTGFIEFALIGVLFGLSAKLTTGSAKRAMLLPLIGYGFAWAGHFFYEHNKPATFIYPTYSLISDYKMVFNVLTGRESL